eukprot:5538354-Pyramimonas_sp.AAC.1
MIVVVVVVVVAVVVVVVELSLLEMCPSTIAPCFLAGKVLVLKLCPGPPGLQQQRLPLETSSA